MVGSHLPQALAILDPYHAGRRRLTSSGLGRGGFLLQRRLDLTAQLRQPSSRELLLVGQVGNVLFRMRVAILRSGQQRQREVMPQLRRIVTTATARLNELPDRVGPVFSRNAL